MHVDPAGSAGGVLSRIAQDGKGTRSVVNQHQSKRAAYRARLETVLPPLLDRMSSAAEASGRESDSVRLVAVTKSHPLEAVEAALACGLRDLGENRVAELASKAARITGDVRWHMIGPVQSRKAADVAAVADVVHSLDRHKLARRLSNACHETQRTLAVLLQVNTSGEASKGGYSADEVLDEVGAVLELPHLEVRGLMTMAPYTDDSGLVRATFRRLRELHEQLLGIDDYTGTELSMGMTNDFEIAIQEGSTLVRVGTALFGERT